MSKVFAVFSKANVRTAIELLSEHGYADDYKVLDRYNLRNERLLGLPGQGSTGGSASEVGGIRVMDIRNDPFPREHTDGGLFRPRGYDTTRNGTDVRPDVRSDDAAGTTIGDGETDLAVQRLREMDGLSEDQARYFARRIFDGASVIVVEVDGQDQVHTVKQLLDRAGAHSADT